MARHQHPPGVPAEPKLTRAQEKTKRHILKMVADGDIAGLRRQARKRGLLCRECRAEAWPLLLGIDVRAAGKKRTASSAAHAAGANRSDSPPLASDSREAEQLRRLYDSTHIQKGEPLYDHPERGQLDLDLNRSLHFVSEHLREDYRDALRRVLLSALTDYGSISHSKQAKPPVDPRTSSSAAAAPPPPGTKGGGRPPRWYYQGLHDIASVLLLVLGETIGTATLERLLSWHLSPWMEGGMQPMKSVLSLLPGIIACADKDFAALLDSTLGAAGMGSDYALPWLITWFTHNFSQNFDACCRLVDYALATPPIAMLYLCAAVAISRKPAVVEYDEDTMHYAMLSRLPPNPSIERWTAHAEALLHEMPPARLVASRFAFYEEIPRVLQCDASPLFYFPADPTAVDVNSALEARARAPASKLRWPVVALPSVPHCCFTSGFYAQLFVAGVFTAVAATAVYKQAVAETQLNDTEV
ncbi:GTPase-activating protein gyp10 [Diplonema papillatum]|nr:GTPase-activating protein gyp10 [Diplonema papillatum]